MTFSAETYFDNLQTDLEQLQLGWHDRPIIDICHLVDELECTTAISTRTAKRRFQAATNIGEMIQQWAPVSFNPDSNGIGICPEAEPKFIANADSVDNEYLSSPLIIIDNDRPAALVKAYGEPTIYSFRDNKPRGLLRDTICINGELGQRVRKLPKRRGAYLLELNQIKQPFVPMRVSALAVPGHFRAELSDSNEYWSVHGLDLATEPLELEEACAELMTGDAKMLRLNQFGALQPTYHKPHAKTFA